MVFPPFPSADGRPDAPAHGSPSIPPEFSHAPFQLNNCLGVRLDAFPQELLAKFEGRLNRGCTHAVLPS